MFERVHIENFLSHRDSTLHLADAGLVLIEGQVVGSSSVTSNGAGKSALLDAIVFALFSRTFRGSSGEQVISRQVGRDCLVELGLRTARGDAVTITRPVKCVKVPRPYVTIGAEKYVGDAEVKRVVGMLLGQLSFDSFVNSVMFKKSGFFTSLTDAQRKDVLEELAGLAILSRTSTIAKQAHLTTTTTLEAAKTTRAQAEQTAALSRKHFQEMKALGEFFATERQKRLDAIQRTLAENTATLERWVTERQTLASALGQHEINLRQARATRDQYQQLAQTIDEQAKPIESRLTYLGAMLDTYTKQVKVMEALPEACPTCEQPIDPERMERKIGLVKATLAETNANRKVVLRGLTRLYQAKDTLNPKLVAAREAVEEAMRAELLTRERLSTLTRDIGNLQTRFQELHAEHLEVQSAQGVAETEMEQLAFALDEAEAAVVTARKTLEAAEAATSYTNFWVASFAPTGLKARILGLMLPRLNAVAPRFAEILCDGEIAVKFLDQVTLKTGETRNKFDVEVTVKDSQGSYEDASDGERQRADLITTLSMAWFAQSRLSAPIKLLILDEPLDGLDQIGIERAIGLLNFIAKEHGGTILTISHRSGLSDLFPKTIRVIKQDGVSQIAP